MSLDFARASRELLRALRGGRSQTALSRRLGFRSNVAAKWESGQRMPKASEALRYSERLGVDVTTVLRRFQPNVELQTPSGTLVLSDWLTALRGGQRLSEIADKCGLSRYSVGRFLTGHSEPRLPQFLELVEALTQRADELVDAWVGIDQVPALRPRFVRAQAAREAMMQRPICLAVMCLLDTGALRRRARSTQVTELSRLLERPEPEMSECLELLREGGVIALTDDRYLPVSALTVDARTSKGRRQTLQEYWATLGARRAGMPGPDDVCSYNVFSIARRDYDALRQLQREFYRTARALIAASEPTELAGLLMVQMVSWDPESSAERSDITRASVSLSPAHPRTRGDPLSAVDG